MIKIIMILFFFLIASSTHAQQSFNKLNVNELDVTSRVNVISTTKSSKPCPAMTETQRNAIVSPLNGSCIYNTTTSKLNVRTGSIWKAAGGGVDNWATATVYAVDDIVIESSKIYQCLIAHTSGTFATDLAASRWTEISATTPVNLTGPITSVGAATSVASQTGTGSTFVMNTSPTLVTPVIGAATGTSLTLSGAFNSSRISEENMLPNGDVEINDVSMFTCGAGNTCSRTTTSGEFSKNTAALKIATSAAALNVTQVVSTPAGVQKQGYLKGIYRVPAAVTDFQICTYIDSVEQVCIPSSRILNNGLFNEISIPLTFGTTSHGWKIKTTATNTQNFFFDGIVVAQGLPTPVLDTSFFFGRATTPTTTNCAWSMTGTTFSNFSADADCPVPTVSGRVQAPGTKIPAIVIPANSASGYYTIIAKGSLYASASTDALCNYRMSDGTIDGSSQSAGTNGSFSAPAGQNIHTFDYTSGITTAKTIQIQSREMTGSASACLVNADSNGQALEFEVHYTPPTSVTTYDQSSANYSRRAFTATSPNSSVTFSSQSCFESRDGEFLELDCYVVASASTGSEARIALPNGLTTSANIGTRIPVGQVNRTGSSTTFFHNSVMAEPSTTYIVFGRQDSGVGSITKTTGASAFGTEAVNFNARIPIAGWENSNVIRGSFGSYNSTPGTTNPKIFSWKVTTTSGTVTDNKGGVVTGCSAANGTVCSFTGLTSAPTCTYSVATTSASVILQSPVGSTTSSSITIGSYDNAGGAPVGSIPIQVICHGE